MQNQTSLQKTGNSGEAAVANHLQKQGFTILAQNYSKPYGEIDLIAQKDDVLAFIEVKTRHNPLFDMAELVPYSKQKKIIPTALTYCAANNIANMVYRFDVAMVVQTGNAQYEISIIENAFGQGW